MALEPEVVKPDPKEGQGRKRRVQVRYKIRSLPLAVHQELDRRLLTGDYSSMRALSLWLEQEHGRSISPSALANYRKHELDPTLQAVKLATAQAAEIVRVIDGDEDDLNFALFRLVQTAIFDLLVQLNRTRHLVTMLPDARHRSDANLRTRALNQTESEQGQDQNVTAAPDPPLEAAPVPQFLNKVELAAITALGKTVAMVSRALLEARRWRAQTRERLAVKVAATSEKMAMAVKEGGLSAAAEKSIRAALMEIKV
jgi:hypothetical protein